MGLLGIWGDRHRPLGDLGIDMGLWGYGDRHGSLGIDVGLLGKTWAFGERRGPLWAFGERHTFALFFSLFFYYYFLVGGGGRAELDLWERFCVWKKKKPFGKDKLLKNIDIWAG